MEVTVKKLNKIDDKETRDENIFVIPNSAEFTVTANDVIKFAKEKNILCYVVEKNGKSTIIGWDIKEKRDEYIDSHNYDKVVEKINKEKYIIIGYNFMGINYSDVIKYYTQVRKILDDVGKAYYVMYRPIFGCRISDNIDYRIDLPEDKIYLLGYYADYFRAEDYFNFFYNFNYVVTGSRKNIYRTDIAQKRKTKVKDIIRDVDIQLKEIKKDIETFFLVQQQLKHASQEKKTKQEEERKRQQDEERKKQQDLEEYKNRLALQEASIKELEEALATSRREKESQKKEQEATKHELEMARRKAIELETQEKVILELVAKREQEENNGLNVQQTNLLKQEDSIQIQPENEQKQKEKEQQQEKLQKIQEEQQETAKKLAVLAEGELNTEEKIAKEEKKQKEILHTINDISKGMQQMAEQFNIKFNVKGKGKGKRSKDINASTIIKIVTGIILALLTALGYSAANKM
jgi:hypothetical protein